MNTSELIEPWKLDAACVGVKDDFFDLREPSKTKLRSICATCRVSDECMEYALFSPQTEGMWSGATPDERKEMLQVSTDPRAVAIREVAGRYDRHGETG